MKNEILSTSSCDTTYLLEDKISDLSLRLQCADKENFVTKDEFLRNLGKYLELLTEMQIKNIELKNLKEKSEELNKQLKEQVERVKDMANIAKSANAAKDVFLANISHEFRTPMNIIMGYTELLLDTIKSEEVIAILQIIHKRSMDMLRLVNDLMDISKIEAGKLSLISEKTEIKSIIAEVLKSVNSEVKNKRLKIKVDLDKNIPKFILTDPLRLKQVLFNLISNSIKFTDKGYVSISCQKQTIKSYNEEINLMFRVSDTGIGIPKQKHSELFKPFAQVQESASKKCGGSGLGLAISKKLVEMMGGVISVENNAPRGVTFAFTIVAKSFEEKQFAIIDEVFEKTDIANKKIIAPQKINLLLVEDEANTMEMMISIISMLDTNSNLNIMSARNGQEAMSIYYEGKIDLILTDMLMPIMDGYSMMSQIRSLEQSSLKNTPIIAMTAYAMEEDKIRCLSSGADFYLSKPLRREDFVLAVNKAIKRSMDGCDSSKHIV